MSDDEIIQKYTRLIDEFIDGDTTAADFSIEFMDEFIEEESDMSEDTYQILQNMFAEADAYCENPELRDERDLDEDELMEVALETSSKLADKADGTV